MSITARNTGSRPAPYGTGSHPYLDRRHANRRRVHAAPCLRRAGCPSDERGIPAGEARDVTGTDADFRTARAIGDAAWITRSPGWPATGWAGPGPG